MANPFPEAHAFNISYLLKYRQQYSQQHRVEVIYQYM